MSTSTGTASTDADVTDRPEDQRARPGRIVSLDVVRGLLLVVSVVSVSLLAPRPVQLQHAPWIGVRGIDLVFPLFVTLSGCGLAFAYRNRVGWWATTRRVVVLAVCALAFSAVLQETLDPTRVKVTGPLMVYAVLVLVIGLLHHVARGPAAWVVVTTVAALGQVALLTWWETRCPGGVLTPACNPSRGIDFPLLGEVRVYHEGELGHDPEGIPSMLGAFVTASVGVTAGHLALTVRARAARAGQAVRAWAAPVQLLAWSVVVALGAAASGEVLPAMKRLWTTPFALGVAAGGVAVLALAMLALDRPGRPGPSLADRVVWPLVALGRNSLLVYFGSHLVLEVLIAHGEPSWAEQLAERTAFLGGPQLGLVVVMLASWVLLASVLHWRRIYLRP